MNGEKTLSIESKRSFHSSQALSTLDRNLCKHSFHSLLNCFFFIRFFLFRRCDGKNVKSLSVHCFLSFILFHFKLFISLISREQCYFNCVFWVSHTTRKENHNVLLHFSDEKVSTKYGLRQRRIMPKPEIRR